MGKYIEPLDFVEVVTDKFEEHGVKRGHIVFVAAVKAFPESENDPYTQRIKMLVHLVKDDHVQYEGGLFIMDPHSLQQVSPLRQRNLTNILAQDTDADNATIN